MSLRSSDDPVLGLWKPHSRLQHLFYGPSVVRSHLLSALPTPTSRVFIVTGSSIASKTPLIRLLEDILGPAHYAGTFSSVRQHGPEADVDAATVLVLANPQIDTILSVGGGSPIDTAKTIAWRVAKEQKPGDAVPGSEAPVSKWLTHIAIPTTLSAAECTAGGGYTDASGVKIGFMAPEMGVSAIFYDPEFAKNTPRQLWLSSGIRALDHAVECMYHPFASEMPWKVLALWAAGVLRTGLTECSRAEAADDTLTRLMLAAYASSGLKGANFKGGMGLSHSLGHALGSPYAIPHGITSCMTLSKVVMLKARTSSKDTTQIARLLPSMGGVPSGNDIPDALEVGMRIAALVETLGLHVPTLTERGVEKAEAPLILERATKGIQDEELLRNVEDLVVSLF